MKFKNILLFFMIAATSQYIITQDSDNDQNSGNDNNPSLQSIDENLKNSSLLQKIEQQSDQIKKSDAMPDEFEQNIDNENPKKITKTDDNTDGASDRLKQENYNLLQENKKLKEENNESWIRKLWKACLDEKKDLELQNKEIDNASLKKDVKNGQKIADLEKSLLKSQQTIKDMCRKSGKCTGKEDEPYIEFATNLDKQKELELQEKNKLHENLTLKDNKIKELEQNIEKQKITGAQEKDSLTQQLSDEVQQTEKYLKYLKTICEQTDGWDCEKIDEKFLAYHATIAAREKSVNSLKDQISDLENDLEVYKTKNNSLENYGNDLSKLLKNEREDHSKLTNQSYQLKMTNIDLNSENGHLKDKLTGLSSTLNAVRERNEELKTTKGAAEIIILNFFETIFDHKIKFLVGTLSAIGGVILYDNKPARTKITDFFANQIKKLENSLSKFLPHIDLNTKTTKACNFIKNHRYKFGGLLAFMCANFYCVKVHNNPLLEIIFHKIDEITAK